MRPRTRPLIHVSLLMLALAPLSVAVHAEEIRPIDEGFESLRAPSGDWFEAGNAILHPADEKHLKPMPGKGVFINGPTGRTEHFITKAEHGDVQVHVEFLVAKDSNSGVYLQGRYEIQVYDSWGVRRPKHSDCGGIYQRYIEEKRHGYEGRRPRVNASLRPGEWQSFDITFRAPRFDANGTKIQNAKFVKVVHNGQVVHEDQEVTGPTRAAAWFDEKPTGPLMLQGDHGPVAYRNLIITRIDLEKP